MSAAIETSTPVKQVGQVRRDPTRSRILRDRFLVFMALMVAWELVARFLVNPLWVGVPSRIAERLWSLALSGQLARHVGTTLTEAGLGLLLAFAVGVPIGILMARHKYGSAVAEPFVMALYSTPRVALAPLFILWFGIDLLSKVMMAFSIVVFIFILNIQEGLKTVDRDLLDLFKTMRAPRSYITRKILLPWIVPWIIASLRLAVGSALIGAIVAELIGSSAGLGWYIEHSAGRIDTTGVFAGLAALVVIAVVLNSAIAFIEKRTTAWRPA